MPWVCRMKGDLMGRKPNSLLNEFLDKSLDMPVINWETIPPDVNPVVVWEQFDENVEGLVPIILRC